jgi:hypothetical protein
LWPIGFAVVLGGLGWVAGSSLFMMQFAKMRFGWPVVTGLFVGGVAAALVALAAMVVFFGMLMVPGR